jgi:ABC-type glycerol-3-phosphate transport system substrate-binding protein
MPDTQRTPAPQNNTFARRDVLRLGAGLAAIGTLTAACGATTTSSSKTSSAVTGPLSFATWQWGEAGFSTYYANAATAFTQAHPGVSVSKISIPFASYFQDILVQLKANNAPDLIMAGFSDMREYVALGKLAPLDDYIDSAMLSRFYPTEKKYGIVDGHLYGTVMLNSGYNLWYNTKLFKAAGERPPTSLAEVLPIAHRLAHTPQIYGIAVDNRDSDALVGDVNNWLYGWAPGANWVNAAGYPALTNPTVKAALEFYKSILDSGVCVRGTTKDEYRAMMAEGKIAMMVDGPWYYAMAQATNPDSKTFLTTAPPPTPTKVTPLADNVLMIPAASKNKAAAGAYIASLYTPHWQQEYVSLTASPPGWENEIPPGYVAANPWYQLYTKYATNVMDNTPPTFASASSEYGAILQEMCSSYFFGGVSLDNALASGQGKLTALLKSL